MIREALQRPGRLRMRLTVVAAASALFALVVLAALVLPSLQHNLEQSRITSLRTSVQAAQPELLLPTFGAPNLTPVELQSLAASAGAARITVFTINGFALHRSTDSSQAALAPRALELVQETANLHRDTSTVTNLPGGRTAVLTLSVSNGGVDGVVLVQAPLHDVQEQVSAVERRLVFGGSLAFGVALLAGLLAAEPLARRLARLRAAADRIARGSFGEPIVDHKGDEIGELARSLDEMRSRLDALERARSAFIANASHELRTPLTALGGYLELLTEGGLTEAERDEFLETMGEQVQRLTKLATDLLDLSRLDAGSLDLTTENVDLAALADSVAKEFVPALDAHGSKLAVELGAGRVEAVCDPDRVAQIMRILLDNALRHTPAGTDVEISADREDGHVRIAVADAGPGLEDATRRHAFDRFFTADGASGSGLGLAIAKELAERMEGGITLTSRPGRTVFSLDLPVSEE